MAKRKPLKVVVKRSRWLRGGHNGKGEAAASYLRDMEGHMCCLGFACRAARIPVSEITHVCTPSALTSRIRIPASLEGLIREGYLDSSGCDALMGRNDRPKQHPKSKEKEITELGRKVGIEFSFVD